jgi:hypothetical protein
MNSTGKVYGVLLALLLFLPCKALGDVTATVDRDVMAMGETLRLTITATEGENTKEADLRPLLANFDILQRASSSNYSLVNGRGSHTEQLQLDITPRREGVLRIPAMRVGKGVTNALEVTVRGAPEAPDGGQAVIFEAEVDRDSVYVQGQVILTLRLQQSINLDNRSVSELELDNAFISKLEQKSFQRNIDGRQWLVHEIRYAVFPEQSGTLEIPAQTFTARVPGGRRSLFDMAAAGRLMRRQSEPLSIDVLPVPDEYPDGTWLPARQVTITEQWSTPPDELRAGESATRTLRIQGEGVQGAQLPPVLFSPVDGLKLYPDQPQISDQEISTGLMGTRVDSAAVVPMQEGNWELPEIRIPWWDTHAQQLRYATVPARTLSVAPADPATVATAAAPVADPGAVPEAPAAPPAAGSNLAWQLLALFSSLGWLATLGWLAWQRRGAPQANSPATAHSTSARRALASLRAACDDNDARAARRAVIDWANAVLRQGKAHDERGEYPQNSFSSLQQVADRFGDDELTAALRELESTLYGADGGAWSGLRLAGCAKRLHSDARATSRGEPRDELRLYPQSA